MKLFFFAINQSPFIVELVDILYGYLPQGSSVTIILQKKLDASRSHWGEKICNNPVHILGMPTNVLAFLDVQKPNCIVFTGYREKKYHTVKRWALKNDAKFFLNCSEKIWEHRQNPLFVWLKYKLFESRAKGINGMLAVSNRAMEKYQKHSVAPTIVIPYTFDMSRLLAFKPLEYDGSEITFLISGRLEQFRDPVYSVRLFDTLRKMRPKVKMNLIISGKGSLYERVVNLLKELEIDGCTTWINDFSDWSEIHEIYKKAHILLCFQEYGGWGLIVPEAMAAGMLVACSSTVDSGDNCIIDGYNGFYCNRLDMHSTIESILKVVDDPALFGRIRNNSRESIKFGDVHYYAERLASFLSAY